MPFSVRCFLYPTFSIPLPTLNFCDQFAFRPTGSTTAALIYILHTVTYLLTANQYVAVIALDFSKAFDTVRHSTLLEKMADLAIQTKFITGWYPTSVAMHNAQDMMGHHRTSKKYLQE